ncbi:hypothetical protein AVEN_54572-1 [Araneus ventricosus]|uniref:Uncharacterized protein n=1 Tax=Araneus ventricosus TaxID=182803 RepID=A0A4Y2BNZ3_ARAVE|nr:hypothetical protein AVEN_54572-1 [Araneus ventricosus]
MQLIFQFTIPSSKISCLNSSIEAKTTERLPDVLKDIMYETPADSDMDLAAGMLLQRSSKGLVFLRMFGNPCDVDDICASVPMGEIYNASYDSFNYYCTLSFGAVAFKDRKGTWFHPLPGYRSSIDGQCPLVLRVSAQYFHMSVSDGHNE